MRSLMLVLWSVGLVGGLAGCGNRQPVFDCDRPGAQCSAGETCVVDRCAADNPACSSGLEYTESAGELAGECVPPGLIDGVDAGAEPDAPVLETCGNAMIDMLEDCDGQMLGGQTCEGLGQGHNGGVLACTPGTCQFDTSGCTSPPKPTVPAPRLPMNGAHVGSVHVVGSRRPRWEWTGSTVEGGAAITYELQYSADPAFPAGAGTTTVMTSGLLHQPGNDIAVSVVPPVGTRFWWRVRACTTEVCSDYSRAWYVNVGRTEHDMNGDGFADLAVGHESDATSGANAGRLRVYFGGSGAFNTTADVTLTGNAGERMGATVRWLGDVNADGFGDLGVRATERVVVLHGSTTPDNVPDAVLPSLMPSESIGDALRGCDVDGDGFQDVVLGAPLNDLGGVNAGRVYVHPGSVTGLGLTPAATLTGPGPDAKLGTDLVCADLNGDGFADAAIAGNGAVHAYLGSSGFFAETASLTVPPDGTNGQLAATDLNQDGFAELIIPRPSATVTKNQQGKLSLHLGAPTVPGSPSAQILGLDMFFFLGKDVVVGDFSGDGFPDVAASFGDSIASAYPGIQLAFGSGSDLASLAFAEIERPIGSAVYSFGGGADLNGDGRADFVVVDGLEIEIYFGSKNAPGVPFDEAMDASIPNAGQAAH